MVILQRGTIEVTPMYPTSLQAHMYQEQSLLNRGPRSFCGLSQSFAKVFFFFCCGALQVSEIIMDLDTNKTSINNIQVQYSPVKPNMLV